MTVAFDVANNQYTIKFTAQEEATLLRVYLFPIAVENAIRTIFIDFYRTRAASAKQIAVQELSDKFTTLSTDNQLRVMNIMNGIQE